MKQKKCSGCGIELQSKDSTKNGYLPQSVIEKNEFPVCQRCFKIKNYGSYLPIDLTDEDYKNEVKKLISAMDIIVWVVDIIDFEGSFEQEIIDLIKGKKLILAINKVDLIPGGKHAAEVSDWVKVRLFKAGLEAKDIAIVSTKTSYGVNGMIRKLKHFLPRGGKAAIIGVTNVGKSSLINGWFGKDKSTVSKYPGTTLKTVMHKFPKFDLVMYDSPGIIPKGRVSDLVCHECNLKIVPSAEISRKTYKIKKDRVIILGGLASVRVLTDAESLPIFSIYASKFINFHETNMEKADELLRTKVPELLSPPCEECKDSYFADEFKKEIREVEEGEELVIKGLGWITVKRGPLKVEVTLPKLAELIIRDAFIEPRRESF